MPAICAWRARRGVRCRRGSSRRPCGFASGPGPSRRCARPWRRPFQRCLDARQVTGLGHQAGKPQYLLCVLRAFVDQLGDEADLAALAPQFVVLAAEVEHRQFALGVLLAKILPLALAAAGGFFARGMEGRVAQGQVEAFILLQQAAEDVLAVGLLAQADAFARRWPGRWPWPRPAQPGRCPSQ